MKGRGSTHGEGALLRQIGLLLRRLAGARLPATKAVRAEARRLAGVMAGMMASMMAGMMTGVTSDPGSPAALEAAVVAALYPLIVSPVPA